MPNARPRSITKKEPSPGRVQQRSGHRRQGLPSAPHSQARQNVAAPQVVTGGCARNSPPVECRWPASHSQPLPPRAVETYTNLATAIPAVKFKKVSLKPRAAFAPASTGSASDKRCSLGGILPCVALNFLVGPDLRTLKWPNIIVARTAAILRVEQPCTNAEIAEPSPVMRSIFSAAQDVGEVNVPAVANHVTVAAFLVLPITLVWVRSNSASAR